MQLFCDIMNFLYAAEGFLLKSLMEQNQLLGNGCKLLQRLKAIVHAGLIKMGNGVWCMLSKIKSQHQQKYKLSTGWQEFALTCSGFNIH
ncbi:hypothetical protein OWV82_002860 [Melia azedarach]|uniref:Uncharacterized protein n=1 Tax=Melia azedarach TaxID=155640 RepID=A0ACC1Z2R3_MELAZ|nr:hypothetical protein OWV82_002860 [Melia azedarach]